MADRAMADAASACRRRTDCRLCGSTTLTRVLSLAPTPPANAFVASPDVEQASYPLEVLFCDGCAHVQLAHVVDPEVLFADYVYVSGTSPAFVRHFEAYAAALSGYAALRPGDFVVDIGSNDGTLLRFFQDAGMKVLGVDPARAIARQATAAGVETIGAFFSAELAGEIRQARGRARAITANNVFAHVDDLADVVEGVRTLLAPDGVFAFEVSYLADVYEHVLFDTIYHEHLDYHAVAPLVGFFRRHGLELVAAERIPTHGGSIRGLVRQGDAARRIEPSVERRIAEETALGVLAADGLRRFGARIDVVRDKLLALVRGLKADGRSIAGYGAPAKLTTLMHHFGLGPAVIDFIVDDSPLKQGLYTPGLHVPVLSPRALDERRPDYLVIFAWNFAQPIMAKQQAFARRGGRFIVPLPEVAVH
jgi:SAM-dependent methyltransferase